MSSDLVQKLRDGNTLDIGEAADRIEALEGEVARLKADLESADADANRFQSIAIEADNEKMLADARAERLRVALEGMVHYSQHAEHWQDDNPQFVEAAVKALEDQQ